MRTDTHRSYTAALITLVKKGETILREKKTIAMGYLFRYRLAGAATSNKDQVAVVIVLSLLIKLNGILEEKAAASSNNIKAKKKTLKTLFR